MPENATILIVDDEPSIVQMLKLTLLRENYKVLTAGSTQDALQVLKNNTIDLLLLDWMLPEESGVEFTLKLRRQPQFKLLPILMLTAKTDEDDLLTGFNAGVDDYVAKPFAAKELLARIQSLLRRTAAQEQAPKDDNSIINLAGITLNPVSHLVTDNNDRIIHLGPTEFKLLAFFMSNPNRVYSRDRLLDNVWGETVYIDERTVDVHIRRLRKALEPCNLAHVIRTVRGSGYTFTTLQ